MAGRAGERDDGGHEAGVEGPQAPSARSHVRRGVVATLVGGAFWGLNGTVAKFLMDNYAIDPLWFACVRELSACWLFLAAAAITNRDQLRQVVREPASLLGILWVSLGAILSSQVAYLEAIDWTNSATATVMQSLGMVGVMAYVCVRTRRAPRRRETVGLALALVGTFLITTGGNPGQLSLPVGGVLWGLACATASALLSILPAPHLARWGSFVVNGLAFLFSGTILAIAYQPWNHMPQLDALAVALLVACVVVGTFGAYALYLQGVKDAGPMRASLLGTIEPVMATLATVLWLQTSFSPVDIMGFAMVIAMVFLTA